MEIYIILQKLLDEIDKGVTTDEIRSSIKNNTISKYILGGKKKRIIINHGGRDINISKDILEEMVKRGDDNAKKILNHNFFRKVDKCTGYDGCFVYLDKDREPDRENKILIDMIMEKKFKNYGGMTLCVYEVPVEDWCYEIRQNNDMWGTEYIEELIPCIESVGVMEG